MKYYVVYCEDGTPSFKEFKSDKARKEWLLQWLLKNHHQGINNGYEIEYLFEGNVSYRYGRKM